MALNDVEMSDNLSDSPEISEMDFSGFSKNDPSLELILRKKRKLDLANSQVHHLPNNKDPNQVSTTNQQDPTTSTSIATAPTRAQIGNNNFCSICKKTSATRTLYMIKCSQCQGKAHLTCAKISRQQADLIRNWHCPQCLNASLGIPENIPASQQNTNHIPSDFATDLANLKSRVKIFKRLPKPIRGLLAGILSDKIEAVLSDPSENTWWHLLTFAYRYLLHPEPGEQEKKKKKKTVASVIRDNVNASEENLQILLNKLSLTTSKPLVTSRKSSRIRKPTTIEDLDPEKLAARVKSKLADKDIRSALCLLTSNDKLLAPDTQTIATLKEKHPAAPTDFTAPTNPDQIESSQLSVDEDTVLSSVKSMRPGSSGGLDGIRPVMIQQMLSKDTAENGLRLLSSLTKLVNHMLSTQLPNYVSSSVFGASLCPFSKEGGGVRPIAVGSIFRRLPCRIAAHYASNKLASELSPKQLGVGIKGGCETAVHSLRQYVCSNRQQDQHHVVLKVDVKNAFNSVNREAIFKEVQARCPEIYQIVHQPYSFQTPLFVDTVKIMSQTGVQQGDPLGPLCFALAIDPIIRAVKSPMNTWYLDDGVLAGPTHIVARDLQALLPKFKATGLELNPNKCEVTYLSPVSQSTIANSQLKSLLPGLKITPITELTLLNSPILPDAISNAIDDSSRTIKTICNRIIHLDSHTALFILTHYTSTPRLNYLMRSAPVYLNPNSLKLLDNMVQSTAIKVTNVKLEGPSWQQASLPTRFGGLGLRRVESLALPCYIASFNKSLDLMQTIIPESVTGKPNLLVEAEQKLIIDYPNIEIPTGEAIMQQHAWDEAVSKIEFSNLINSANQVHSARLLAASSPHTGAWLHTLPISELGLLLDAETVRIGVALRVGAQVCEPHKCRCGAKVDNLGMHGLSCRRSAGRLPRHSNLNDIVKRSLEVAGMPAWMEPAGLDRGDGRRPDGITVFPFSNGKCLTWDATCSDTFCKSNIGDTAHTPGAAADKAELRKRTFYSSLETRYRFEPISVETTGVLGKSTEKFVAELGRRISGRTGERRETEWLRQRISIAIVRGNAASVMATSAVQ